MAGNHRSALAKILFHAARGRDFFIDLLFPVECIGCGQEGEWLCPRCFRRLEYALPCCLGCKRPNEDGRFCPACRGRWALDGVFVIGDYENKLLAAVVKLLKYRFVRGLAPVLSAYIARGLNNRFGRAFLSGGAGGFPAWFGRALILSVPLHSRRRKWRGFNQSELIARDLARQLGRPLGNSLVRVKHKKPQMELRENERRENINGCFAYRGENLKGAPVILVDDVVTTGSTLDECARVLKAAGAGRIWGLVAAKG